MEGEVINPEPAPQLRSELCIIGVLLCGCGREDMCVCVCVCVCGWVCVGVCGWVVCTGLWV